MYMAVQVCLAYILSCSLICNWYHIIRPKRWLIDFRIIKLTKLPRKIIQGSEDMQVKIIVKILAEPSS